MTISPVFRNETPKVYYTDSIEDAGWVEDPTLLVRPCKTIGDGRSLVLVSQSTKCIEEEVHHQQKFLFEAHPEVAVYHQAASIFDALAWCY